MDPTADLWVGREAPLADCRCLLQQLDGEGIESGLAAVVLDVSSGFCAHAADWRRPCPPCARELLVLVEMVRGSASWELHAGDFESEVDWFEQILATAGVTRAPVPGLTQRYDPQEQWPIDYLTKLRPALRLGLSEARHVIFLAQAMGLSHSDVIPRDDKPSRAGATGAELEIAKRMGWQQPQRWDLEVRIRAAAVAALNEAHFVQLCREAGVGLIPKTGALHSGIAGYSAYLAGLSTEHRREYAGESLAKDLTLPALRRSWDQWPVGDEPQAWATWLTLCPDLAELTAVPGERADGRWEWILPQVVETSTDLEVPELIPNPTHQQVRTYLLARQGHVCAMCQIQRHGWEATRHTPVPWALLGTPEHLDHDHTTGLIRGMLCIRCNTFREPWGARTLNDVWHAYTTHPPIGTHKVFYRSSEAAS